MSLPIIYKQMEAHTGIRMTPNLAERLADPLQRLAAEQTDGSYVRLSDYLEDHPSKLSGLVQYLAVNESYLYREPHHFQLINDRLIPDILQQRPFKKVQLLSAGCAGGEEPFSLAISLVEQFGLSWTERHCDILGADIDETALARAAAGAAHRHSVHNIDEALLRRHFEPADKGAYQISDALRRRVRFQRLNLAHVPYPAAIRDTDIILYRNVSIYFSPETRRKIFNALSNTLAPGGYILVSSTETLSHADAPLEIIEMDGIYMYHKPACGKERFNRSFRITRPVRPLVKASAVRSPHPDRNPPPTRRSTPPVHDLIARTIPRIEKRASEKKVSETTHKEALHLLDQAVQISSNEDLYRIRILEAAIHLDQNQTEAAADICRSLIAREPLHPEAYLLMGLIRQSEANGGEAEQWLRQAFYLQPSNWLVRFLLANRYQRTGKARQAYNGYQQIIRMEKSGELSDHGLPDYMLTISREQVMKICREAIERLAVTRN